MKLKKLFLCTSLFFCAITAQAMESSNQVSIPESAAPVDHEKFAKAVTIMTDFIGNEVSGKGEDKHGMSFMLHNLPSSVVASGFSVSSTEDGDYLWSGRIVNYWFEPNTVNANIDPNSDIIIDENYSSDKPINIAGDNVFIFGTVRSEHSINIEAGNLWIINTNKASRQYNNGGGCVK